MSIFSTIAWKLMPDEKKLRKLRERGLTIGGGARFSTGTTSDLSRTSLRLETMCG